MKNFYLLILLNLICLGIIKGETFTVTNTAPVSVDSYQIPGSFIWAILQAATNGDHTLDDIVFDIDEPQTNGVYIINIIQSFQITTPVRILGHSQPGAYLGNPKIFFEGSEQNDGLQFALVIPGTGLGGGSDSTASGSTIQGIMMGNYTSFGLALIACNNMTIEDFWIGFGADRVSSTNAGSGNKGITLTGVAGNNLNAANNNVASNITIKNSHIATCLWLGIEAYNIDNLLVENCKFGTDQNGFNSNDFGIGGSAIQTYACRDIQIKNCTFGGNSRNAAVLGQNGRSSIGTISIGSSTNVVIDNNIIGEAPDESSDDMWNGAYGIYIWGSPQDPSNRMDGTCNVTISENRINNTRTVGGWAGHGIHIHDVDGQEVRNIVIQSNDISGNEGNGIHISGNVNDNVIGSSLGVANETLGNTISSNGLNGVTISNGALRNTIRQNQIYCNGGTSGNVGDPFEIKLESGGNLELPEPVFNSDPGAQPITGTCHTGDWIDFYAMSDCKNCAPGEKGDGENWLGGVTCTGSTFAYNGPTADKVAATATDPNGNTSEFTSCMEHIDECDAPVVWVSDDFGMCGTHMNVANVNLAGSTPNGSQIGTWSHISGPTTANFVSPNSPFTTAENLVGGIYVFRWTVNDVDNPTCMSFAEITVTVDPVPSPADAGSLICATDTVVTLSANTPISGTGTWSVVSPAGPVIDNPNSNVSTARGLIQNGVNNRFRWSINSTYGYCGASYNDLIVKTGASYSPGDDIIDCDHDANIMFTTRIENADQPDDGNNHTFLWTYLEDGESDVRLDPDIFYNPYVHIDPAAYGKYSFIYQVDGDICPDTLRIYLGTHVPDTKIIADVDSLCKKDTAYLEGVSANALEDYWTAFNDDYMLVDGFDLDSNHIAVTNFSEGEYTFLWNAYSICGPVDTAVSFYSFHVLADTHPKCLITTTNGIAESGVNFYPNPVKSLLIIENESGNTYRIFNNQGISVLNGKIEAANETLNVSSLKRGIYFLQINDPGNSKQVKFIIE